MLRLLCAMLVASILSVPAADLRAQEEDAAASATIEKATEGKAPDDPAAAFETYYFVFLKRGEKASEIPAEELERIQKGHLAHLRRLHEEGKTRVAGPFEVPPDHDTRGIVIYPGDMEREEVERLASADPAVQAGRLRVEILRWWVPKGRLFWHPPEAVTP